MDNPEKEAPASAKPYLLTERVVIDRAYNPNYGDDRKCKCGHPYYRHFDSYENMEPVGCKYCSCDEFVEDVIEVIQFYPVESGEFYAGEYPGARTPEKADQKLEFLIGLGIKTFIDLTEKKDQLEPYQQSLKEGITYHNFGIRDRGLPQTRAHMREILDTIHQSIKAGKPVYVHCWGGIGRTGTVVGCWLAETGYGEDAAERVQEIYARHMAKVSRMPNSPETPEQREYIRNWGKA